VKNIIEELKWLIKKYDMKEVFFDDGTFNISKKRAIDISKAIIQSKIKILWGCSCRVDKVDKEMLHYMKKSGCRIICYGPESASKETLKKINKGIDIDQSYRAIQLTKREGIIAHANFMVGFPWETEKELYETIRFAKKLDPDTIQISLVFPHPGSKMYDQGIKNKWFKENTIGNWNRFEMSKGPVLKTHIPQDELQSAISKGHAQFFFRPIYIIKTLLKIRSISELWRTVKGAHSVIKGKIIYNISKKQK